jgi:hypothetical protein
LSAAASFNLRGGGMVGGEGRVVKSKTSKTTEFIHWQADWGDAVRVCCCDDGSD